MAKIRFREVQKLYPTTSSNQEPMKAVEDFDLDIQQSEVVSIVGPTGCGKSTSLNMIAGFDAPTEGAVLLDGVEVQKPGPDRAVVFQQPSLFPWLTVFQNVVLGVKSRGMAKSEYRERADQLLNAVALRGFERHYPYQLSGGMQQRVQIARALVGSPEVLLMDEPFGALDYQTRLTMQELLLELWSEFKPTIFFITHDVSEAIFISDRVFVMTRRPGRLKLALDVPFPKPRNLDFLTTPEFVRTEHDILNAVKEEMLTDSTSPTKQEQR